MSKGKMVFRGFVWIVLLVLAVVVGFGIGTASVVFGINPVGMFAGPKTALSVTSPNRVFEAYVLDRPSIDPPNQSLFVERADKTHFMHIADLAEDIDSIQDITWSPDSRVVVFRSRCYLTATRVTDWQTVRVYLGSEWRRHQPDRYRFTFSSGPVMAEVTGVVFPGNDRVVYKLHGNDEGQVIDF